MNLSFGGCCAPSFGKNLTAQQNAATNNTNVPALKFQGTSTTTQNANNTPQFGAFLEGLFPAKVVAAAPRRMDSNPGRFDRLA